MTNVQPPVFVFEMSDLCTFASVEEAEDYVEVIDVEDGVYAAFDATGRQLRMEVKNGRFWTRRVAISAPAEGGVESDPEVLRVKLVEYLSAIGPEISGVLSPETLSLEELTTIVLLVTGS